MYLNWPERLQCLLPRHAMPARANSAAGLGYSNEIFLRAGGLTIERNSPGEQPRHCLFTVAFIRVSFARDFLD